jgi:hypothetical protein
MALPFVTPCVVVAASRQGAAAGVPEADSLARVAISVTTATYAIRDDALRHANSPQAARHDDGEDHTAVADLARDTESCFRVVHSWTRKAPH